MHTHTTQDIQDTRTATRSLTRMWNHLRSYVLVNFINLSTQFPSIQIGAKSFMEVQLHKLVGVTIGSNLSLFQHISATSKKISKKVYQLS